jgi:hypothetical protein
MDTLWTDLKWLVFQTQYCVGPNLFGSRVCRDFWPWLAGAAALLALVVAYFAWSWAAKKVRAWLWRREQARVADKETMDSVRWSGYDPKK